MLLLTLALHCLLAWLYANQARAAINKPWQLIKRDGARAEAALSRRRLAEDFNSLWLRPATGTPCADCDRGALC
ncbi:hypothetical protein BOC51_20940 [Burkholderia pseudomallei]|nr:hypothetical protein BOC39_05580 [Burkholderia pseudomallei]ARL52427.1 hypothetical protein BOC51_20940 [Burkholderia pseudomallei]